MTVVRLTNTTTGAVVTVAAETAARLGSEWESAEKPAPKTTAKKSASSSKTEK